MKKNIYIVFWALSVACISSCTKSEFLNEKPDQALVIPETLSDLQAILNNLVVMNGDGYGVVPSFGQIGSDDYWLLKIPNISEKPLLMQLYTWGDTYENESLISYNEWEYPYRAVLYSNIVLEGLAKLNVNHLNEADYNIAKGSALFFRAHMFYQLAQVFAPPYNTSSAATDLGIPLKLKADVSEKIDRSSLEDTYQQIINDLKLSMDLLNVTSKQVTTPSKPAIYGLLARVYLSMRNYSEALFYANKCLELKSTLRDFNPPFTDISSPTPFDPQFSSEEIIFHSRLIDYAVDPIMNSISTTRVDSNLYHSYAENDLRKKVYFLETSNGYYFKGSYEGGSQLFAGIATDEIYLIRAECYARAGNVKNAMADLNTLMKKRWLDAAWIPFTASSPEQALTQILTERRKELVFRGLRWTDMRRLNLEGANIRPTRTFEGEVYTLEPNSKRYTYLIPQDVMTFHPDWKQNPR